MACNFVHMTDLVFEPTPQEFIKRSDNIIDDHVDIWTGRDMSEKSLVLL